MFKINIKLKYRILLLFLVLIVFVLLIIFLKNKDIYDIRISIKLDNYSAFDMDNIFALNLTKEFLNIKSIDKCTTISSQSYCNIYLKFKILSNKTKNIQKVKIALDNFISKSELFPEITFDSEFNKKYDIFLIFYLDEYDNNFYKKFNHICSKLAAMNSIYKILDFQNDNITDYIYFSDSDLITYDITPFEIKELIKQNNLGKDSSVQENNYSYMVNLNSNIADTEDLKNINLYYQNKDFSNTFKNVFKIERKQDSSVFYDQRKVKLIAIRKNPLIPLFVADLIINNELKNIKDSNKIKYEIINTKNLSKIELKIKDNPNQKTLEENIKLISKEFKCALCFLKTDAPMTNSNDNFLEKSDDKIVILTNKKRKLLKFLKRDNINIASQKPKSEMQSVIYYLYNASNINNYFLNKAQLTENIIANQHGLVCDYYFKDSNKINIVLKNNNDSDFIYSKKYKKLLDINLFVSKKLIRGYSRIVRVNSKKI